MRTRINCYTAQGRLTRDPEIKTTNNGFDIITADIAIDASATKEKNDAGYTVFKTAFVTVKGFGKEFVGLYNDALKGDLVDVSGYLETEQWDDKESGAKRSKIVCILQSFRVHPPVEKKEERRDTRETRNDRGGSRENRSENRNRNDRGGSRDDRSRDDRGRDDRSRARQGGAQPPPADDGDEVPF